MPVQFLALPDVPHFETCLLRGNMYCSQSRCPQDFVGCHLKQSPGILHSDRHLGPVFIVINHPLFYGLL